MNSEILQHLTAPQREAVTHMDGPLLVLAGPGSGKTRVVTHRIAHLLAHDVPPSQILALTFTNKAAAEMRRRVESLAQGRRVWISTFHRFCARLLREYAPLCGLRENYSIYDTDDSLRMLKRAIELVGNVSRFVTPEVALRTISSAKSATISPDQFASAASDYRDRQLAEVYAVYQQQLLLANAADFDDLLLHVVHILQENAGLRAYLDERYRYVMVDEYQDTNLAQYAIVRALSIDHRNIMATGDPDQSIYAWRGANLNNILEFENDYQDTRVVRLEQNFRSTQRIVRVADHLISHNRQRKRKSLFSENELGPSVRLVRYDDQQAEAESIADQIAAQIRGGRSPADFAVFYRANALSRVLEKSLRTRGLPYQIVRGFEFYQRREIKDVLAYLHLLNNPHDDAALRRVINVPPRGIGRVTLERLEDFAHEQHLPLLEAARQPQLYERLGARPSTLLRGFVALHAELSRLVHLPLGDIVQRVLDASEYQQFLAQQADDPSEDRWANVQELLSEAREFDARSPEGPWLEPFLETAALVNDTDNWDQEAAKVSLMTLHAAKGLEFPAVFIVGIEEGLLPHIRSVENPEGVEEERRLLFVGITRSKCWLQLSHASYRMRAGGRHAAVPSSFLFELPVEELERVGYHGPHASRLKRLEEASSEEFDGIDEFDAPAAIEDEVMEAEIDEPAEPSTFSTLPMMTAADMLPSPAGQAATGKPSTRKKSTGKPTAEKHSAEKRSAEKRSADERLPDERVPVERFQQGMLVSHPMHGLGQIVALSGQGQKRMATVRFFQPSKDRRFHLAFSPLTPVRSPD
jgi:DNA helicase II / ATP-dependent DNA helicase PcrA